MNTTANSPSLVRPARRWLATLAAGAAVGAVAIAAAIAINGQPSSNTGQAVAAAPTTTAPPPDGGNGNDEYPRTVTVSGHGSVTVKPDVATLSLGVAVTADTATGALGKASEKADALIKALEASGVAEDDIVTSDISVYAQYNETGNRVIGYHASNDVTAKVRQIDTTGAVIDAAAGLVGDEISIGGISFSVADDSDELSAARRAATADALQHATDLTAGVKAKVGKVLTIDETSFSSGPYYPAYESTDGSASVPTPVEPGTQDITVDVTVVFEVQ